jgi:hypothetical protein
VDDGNVSWLVSRTTFSGHLRSDLIRITALSMISGRSEKLGGDAGKDQPATSRRKKSALPTIAKYLAMGTADDSRELSNRGQAASIRKTLPCLVSPQIFGSGRLRSLRAAHLPSLQSRNMSRAGGALLGVGQWEGENGD